jgi:hypothetical protein
MGMNSTEFGDSSRIEPLQKAKTEFSTEDILKFRSDYPEATMGLTDVQVSNLLFQSKQAQNETGVAKE